MPKLVDSILGQTYKNIELILVDDESPDDSGRIADEYAAIDSRVRVIHQKNQGCCEARNSGLAIASGNYIMLADGDDWLELDAVEYLVTIMEQNSCEMAMTDSVFTTSNEQFAEDNIRIMSAEDAASFILYTKTPVGPWNKIYSARVIRDNNLSFSVPWFGEGLYFSCVNAQLSNKVAVGHKRIYHYRLNNPGSGTTVRNVKNAINSLWNINNIRDNLYVRTPKTEYAATWHLHRNYFNLLWYILGSDENTRKEYRDKYDDARKNLLDLTPSVFLHSDVSFFQKILILFTGLMPKTAAKFATARRNRIFKKSNYLNQ